MADTTPIPEIVEGEVIAPEVSPSVAADLDWVAMITNQLTQLDTLKEQLKKFRELLQSIYDNDPTYQEHDQQVKAATKTRNQTKKQLAKLPQVADLSSKIADVRQLIKERNQDLSDYVQQYARSSGATTLETPDGHLHEIVYLARLVKR